MNIDLKKYRKQANLSQKDLAARANLSTTQISRYESRPEKIRLDRLVKLCRALGEKVVVGGEELTQFKPTPLDVLDCYQDLSENVSWLNRYFQQYVGNSDINKMVDTLNNLKTKPHTLFIGPKNSGKSTIINDLLGYEIIPTSYSSTTPFPIVIKDIQDRPKSWNKSLYFMKGNYHPSAVESGEVLKEESFLYSSDWMSLQKADYAILFYGASILKTTTLIDVPKLEHIGNNTIPKAVMNDFGIVTFVLPASEGLNSKVKQYTNWIKDNVNPLQELIPVASQADSTYDMKIIRGTFFKNKRFFTYWRESQKTSSEFKEKLKYLLEKILPIKVKNNRDLQFNSIRDGLVKNTESKIIKEALESATWVPLSKS